VKVEMLIIVKENILLVIPQAKVGHRDKLYKRGLLSVVINNLK